ncbi:hypothetical protein [Amycolatopsis sp. NPDC004378]
MRKTIVAGCAALGALAFAGVLGAPAASAAAQGKIYYVTGWGSSESAASSMWKSNANGKCGGAANVSSYDVPNIYVSSYDGYTTASGNVTCK